MKSVVLFCIFGYSYNKMTDVIYNKQNVHAGPKDLFILSFHCTIKRHVFNIFSLLSDIHPGWCILEFLYRSDVCLHIFEFKIPLDTDKSLTLINSAPIQYISLFQTSSLQCSDLGKEHYNRSDTCSKVRNTSQNLANHPVTSMKGMLLAG